MAVSAAHEDAALAVCAQFLAALGDSEGGEILYRLHAPAAPLAVAQGLQPAREVDCARFALAHREVNLRGRGLLPEFSAPSLLRITADAQAGEAVLWCEVTQSPSQRRLCAAFGLRRHGEGWQVGWSTLAEREATWSYSVGLLQSLADYPWLRVAAPTRARALLDASYWRRHWRSPVTFSTLPDARFGCQMSTACCKHDFEIALPLEAQLVIDAMPWATLKPQLSGTQLPKRADGKLLLKALNETCRFLGAQRQCLIHQTLGRQPFGPCSVFPFAFAHTPEGVAVSLSPICGSVRLGLGATLVDREADFQERLVHAEPRRTDAYRLAPGLEIRWDQFRDAESALRETLAASDLPLRRRLHVGSRLLEAVRLNRQWTPEQWMNEPLAEVSAEMREAIHGMLGKILGWDRSALRALAATVPAHLNRLEVREPQIVARVLQNVLFSKVYSYPFDLTTAHNFVIVLYLLTLVMESTVTGPLPDVLWQELGSLGVHGLLKNILHEGVPEGFRALFGTPEFGLWALAA